MIEKRKVELEQFKQIWLTKEGYSCLRIEKRKQKKSMAAILDSIILKSYGRDKKSFKD